MIKFFMLEISDATLFFKFIWKIYIKEVWHRRPNTNKQQTQRYKYTAYFTSSKQNKQNLCSYNLIFLQRNLFLLSIIFIFCSFA